MLKRLRMFVPFLFVLAIALVVGSSGSVYAEGPDQAAEEAREAEVANDDERKQASPRGKICGTYFYDKNGNGTQEANEPGVAGRTIKVEHQLSGWTTYGITGSSGSYCATLNQINPGQLHTVSVLDHQGWAQTFPTTGAHYVTFAPWNGGPYELISDVNFGARLRPRQAPAELANK